MMLTRTIRTLTAALWGASLLWAGASALGQDEQKPADENQSESQDQPREDAPQDEAKPEEPAGPQPNVRVTNLDNPCGVAVQKGTGHVFVTSRWATYRYLPDETDVSKKINIEIVVDKVDQYGKGPIYDVAHLGLGFLEDGRLIIGGGGHVDSEELLRIYKIGEEAPKEDIAEDAAEVTLGPIPKSDASTTGEGNFYGIAVNAGGIYVTSNGDDTKGWVLRSEIKDGKPGELTTWLATKEKVGVDAPVGITLSPDGELVISQMGEVNVPGDSLLTIYDAASGELKHKYETGLSDIAGVAYHPTSKKLYAVDFAWAEPDKGGLFRLDVEGDSVTATKIMPLDKPTAMAFDANGRLFVTIFGTDDNAEDDKAPGQLLLIEGLE